MKVCKVKGEYISFLDSDDWLELDACEVMISEQKKNDADLVVVGTEGGAFVASGVEHDEVEVLLGQFLLGVHLFVVCLQGKADQDLIVSLQLT